MALMFSLIIRKPTEDISSTAITTETIEKRKLLLRKEIHDMKLKSIGIKLILQIFFLLVLLVVCNNNRKDSMYNMNKNLADVYSNVSWVSDPTQMMAYMEDILIPGLFPQTHYNDKLLDNEQLLYTGRYILSFFQKLGI